MAMGRRRRSYALLVSVYLTFIVCAALVAVYGGGAGVYNTDTRAYATDTQAYAGRTRERHGNVKHDDDDDDRGRSMAYDVFDTASYGYGTYNYYLV